MAEVTRQAEPPSSDLRLPVIDVATESTIPPQRAMTHRLDASGRVASDPEFTRAQSLDERDIAHCREGDLGDRYASAPVESRAEHPIGNPRYRPIFEGVFDRLPQLNVLLIDAGTAPHPLGRAASEDLRRQRFEGPGHLTTAEHGRDRRRSRRGRLMERR